MEKILKGVCVGAGYFSRYHLDGWNRIPEVQITALCDPDQKRAEDRMQEFGIARRYSDYRGMIEREKPDFVDIITPPSTHLNICRHASESHTPPRASKRGDGDEGFLVGVDIAHGANDTLRSGRMSNRFDANLRNERAVRLRAWRCFGAREESPLPGLGAGHPGRRCGGIPRPRSG